MKRLNSYLRSSLDDLLKEEPGPLYCTRTRKRLTREQTWRIVKSVERQANAQLRRRAFCGLAAHLSPHAHAKDSSAEGAGLHGGPRLLPSPYAGRGPSGTELPKVLDADVFDRVNTSPFAESHKPPQDGSVLSPGGWRKMASLGVRQKVGDCFGDRYGSLRLPGFRTSFHPPPDLFSPLPGPDLERPPYIDAVFGCTFDPDRTAAPPVAPVLLFAGSAVAPVEGEHRAVSIPEVVEKETSASV